MLWGSLKNRRYGTTVSQQFFLNVGNQKRDVSETAMIHCLTIDLASMNSPSASLLLCNFVPHSIPRQNFTQYSDVKRPVV